MRVSITGAAAERCCPSTTKRDSIPNEGLIILPTPRRDVHRRCAHAPTHSVDDLIHAHRRAPACSLARSPQRHASLAGGKRQTRDMNEEGQKEEEEEECRTNVQRGLSGRRQ